MIKMQIRVKLKKDRFSARRGGGTKVLNIFCSACGNLVLIYQKDGSGPLLRCYSDRIFYLKKYMVKDLGYVREMPKLICSKCDTLIGVPTRYKKHNENRLAFKMVSASFKKKRNTNIIH